MDFLSKQSKAKLLLLIDFQKAFDCLEWTSFKYWKNIILDQILSGGLTFYMQMQAAVL